MEFGLKFREGLQKNLKEIAGGRYQPRVRPIGQRKDFLGRKR